MKERVKSIDFLRTFAILGVLFIHTTTRTLEAANFDLYGFSWTLFLNQVMRFAVPLFFIISGFVLEVSWRGENYWVFIKRRLSKIFIPYFFWSLIYYFFVYSQNHDSITRVLLTGNASYQLYFIPTLCIFYLIFPLLHKFYKLISNKFVLIFLGISQLYFQYRDYYVSHFDFDDPIRIAILAYFFFVIGIISANNKEKINSFVHKWKYVLVPAVAANAVYIFWEGKFRYLETGNYLSYYSQWRPSVFIYTFLVGLVLFRLFNKTKFQTFVIEKFSKISFLVFFTHVIVLETVWQFIGNDVFGLISGTFWGKIIFDPLFFLMVFIISFLISFILHKIPKIEKLIG